MKRTSKMTKVFLGGGLSLLLMFTLVGPVAAQSWTELSPSGGPPLVRIFHTAVHNPANNRMIVFAGLNGGGFAGVEPSLNDVWVLENADGFGGTPNWIQLSPTGVLPAVRVGHSAVYDPGTNRMTVFAGNLHHAFRFGLAKDVWVLTNADGTEVAAPAWTQLFPTGGPSMGIWNHSAVYDPVTNRMVVFGGQLNNESISNKVWVLENANGLGGMPNWIQLSPTGGPIPARTTDVAGYDQANNRMIVFGGNTNSGAILDVWVLENANGLGGMPNWSQLSPTGGPPTTAIGRSVYNPATNHLIAFGGLLTSTSVTSNEVWVLDNANGLGGTPNWTQLSPSGGPMPERVTHTAVLNVGTNRMTVFGGRSNITFAASNDVWVLDVSPQAPVADAGPDQTVECTTPTTTPVTLDGSASSDPDSDDLTFTWTNSFGTASGINPIVPLGLDTHTITLTVDDSNGGTDTDDVVVEIQDTTPPAVSASDITLEATGPAGANFAVFNHVAASDICSPSLVVEINPLPPYPLGGTLVTAAATDTFGNGASATFTVTVEDTTPPTLTVPPDITAEATAPSGAVVSYSASATDDVDGAITPICSPVSGSTFPLGDTTVTCSATDDSNNTASDTFNVTVRDTTAPTITITSPPSEATYLQNEVVASSYTCADSVSGVASCVGPVLSGSPINTATVGQQNFTVNAIDSHGNSASLTNTYTVVTVSQGIQDLSGVVESFNLQQGIDNALDAKLQNVQESLDAANAGQRQDAVNKLEAFISAVEAQRGGKLTDEQADALIAEVSRILAVLQGSGS